MPSPHPPAHTSPPVAIIGSGPGGLAAAVLLAASGVKVRVYEAAPTIGGRTARIHATNSAGQTFGFDKGPTFFMMPYVLEEVFAAAGKRLQDYAQLHRLDPMYRLLLGRPHQKPLQIDATQDLDEMARRLGAIEPRDGQAFRRFIDDNRAKLRHSESILRNPMRSPLDLFGPETWADSLRVAPMLKPWQSVHEMLGSYFVNPLSKLAVSFQSKYLGMSPFECPSLFTILPFIEYEYGIWHPVGGCHALMQALADVAREFGAEIITDAPVESIRFEGTKAIGVNIAGAGPFKGPQAHDHVIANADATWAIKNLIPESARRAAGTRHEPQRLDKMRYSCSTYMLYLGIEGEIDLPHHTIYVSADYKQNLEDICTLGKLSDDPSVYLCNPSRIDPTLAPKGHSSLYVLVPTSNLKGSIDWTRDAASLRKRTFEQIASVFGLPDLQSRIRAEVQYTPLTWQAENINHGATFNLAHNLGQMLHRRPQNKLQGFDNLYLVGGGTHPGSGLPTIFLSAQISTRMLCKELGVTFAGARTQVREVSARREMTEPTIDRSAALTPSSGLQPGFTEVTA